MSSFEMATTAAPYLRIERQDALQPLLLAGHGVHERLADVGGEPASSASTIELSIESGTSTSDWTSRIVRARIAGSSAMRDARVHVEHVGARLDLGDARRARRG